MAPNHCPNFENCALVHMGLGLETATKENYINNYCKAGQWRWNECKRLKCKEQIHFCPDFVLPDMSLTIDEIVDRFEELET